MSQRILIDTDALIDISRGIEGTLALLIPDALIAATALVTGYPLLSKNQSDYRFIQGINLLPFAP